MVKLRSDHDLQPPIQCPYQVSTSYTLQFPRYNLDKILYLKVTTARSDQSQGHDIAHLHPLTNVPTSTNFLHLTVPEKTNVSRCPPALLDTIGENNTRTVLEGYRVKILHVLELLGRRLNSVKLCLHTREGSTSLSQRVRFKASLSRLLWLPDFLVDLSKNSPSVL